MSAARAALLVVWPDGQRAERDDGVLADMPSGAQYIPGRPPPQA